MPLADRVEDQVYLITLALALEQIRNQVEPDIVFYNAGVDVHNDDKLGRLALTNFGIEQRDRMVISHFRSRNIPVCGVIGGGYSDNIQILAERHSILHPVATEFVY